MISNNQLLIYDNFPEFEHNFMRVGGGVVGKSLVSLAALLLTGGVVTC